MVKGGTSAVGLFLRKIWGEILFFAIAVIQLIAYTKFKDFFGEQGFLVGFHGICIGVYLALKLLEAWRLNADASAGELNEKNG